MEQMNDETVYLWYITKVGYDHGMYGAYSNTYTQRIKGTKSEILMNNDGIIFMEKIKRINE